MSDATEELNRQIKLPSGIIYCQSCKRWTSSAMGRTICGRCVARSDMATKLTGGEYTEARHFFKEAGLSEREIDDLLYSPDFLFGIEVSRKVYMKNFNVRKEAK